MWRWLRVGLLVVMVVGCQKGKTGPLHRDRAKERDRECSDPARPSAFFYPAKNRTDYAPDHPDRDGCQVLVPDHLFCCPDVPRDTDR
jgi:hypothetical protein